MGALDLRLEKLGLKVKADKNKTDRVALADQAGKASTVANLKTIIAQLVGK